MGYNGIRFPYEDVNYDGIRDAYGSSGIAHYWKADEAGDEAKANSVIINGSGQLSIMGSSVLTQVAAFGGSGTKNNGYSTYGPTVVEGSMSNTNDMWTASAPSSFTWECWIRFHAGAAGPGDVISAGAQWAFKGFDWRYSVSPYFWSNLSSSPTAFGMAYADFGTSPSFVKTSAMMLQLETDYHVAWIGKNGGPMQFWVNNVMVQSGAYNFTVGSRTYPAYGIMGNHSIASGGNPVNATFAHIAVWHNVQLTDFSPPQNIKITSAYNMRSRQFVEL